MPLSWQVGQVGQVGHVTPGITSSLSIFVAGIDNVKTQAKIIPSKPKARRFGAYSMSRK